MSNSFGVLGGSGVSATASAGSVVGDVGVSPGSSITLGGTVVTGGIFANIPPATTAHTDAQTAYNQLAGFAVSLNGDLSGQDLGGKVLAPGVYKFTSSAQLTGVLTLNGQGQYVFQIASTLTTASNASVNLINGADASNVFFQIGSSATLGTNTAFQGTIIALASDTLTAGTTLNGRVIALTGAVTLDANTITTTVTTNLIVNGTTFDLGASRNEPVTGVTLSNAGSILGTGTSSLISTGSYSFQDGTVTAILAGNGSALNKTTSGTVTLSGANTYTGATTVTAGTLREGVSNAIADTSTLTVNGPTAVFDLGLNHNDTVGVVTLDGNGSITGTGTSALTSTGSFQVMNGTVTSILAGSGIALNKSTTGIVTLAGANTYTGATTVSAGTLVISPTGSLASTGIVNVAAGAVLTVNHNSTIATLNTNGRINGTSTLTATTYNLNNGAQIDTPLGNGAVISNGSVGVNGILASSNINIQSGTMTLQQANLLNPNATVTVASGAFLVLSNGDNSILGLTGSGTLNETNGILTVTNGFGTFTGTVNGAVANNGSLVTNGDLTIAPGTVSSYPNGTTVTGGTLFVNGILNTPTTTINPGGTLGGSGTVTGDVIDNGGTVSPGNSPGVITIGGNYTEGGTLKIEIAGTSGPGSPTGHDQVVVGGNTTIIPATSTLHLVQDLGFEPAKGDTFKIISGAVGSIAGHFGTFTSDFTNDLILNVDTGQVIGTGLLKASTGVNVLNALPGTNSNQRAMISSLQVGDHQYAGGDLLALLLTPANAAKTSQILNQASPEAYAGLSDYAARTTQAYRNTAIGLAPVAQSGVFTLFAGYSHLDAGSDSSQNQADYDLESNGAVAGARINLGSIVSLGIFTGFDFGSVKSNYLSSTVNGQVSGIFFTVDPMPDHRLSVLGGFTYGTFTTKGTRQTFSGSSTMPDVNSSDYRFDLGVQYLALKKEKFSLTPEVNISFGQSKVGDFTENNTADPLQALRVHGQNNTSFVASAGLNGVYSVTGQVDLTARIGVSQELDHSYRDVTANVANHSGDFTVRAPGMGDTEFNLGAGVNYNVTKLLRLSLSYQAGFSANQKISNAVFLGVSISF